MIKPLRPKRAHDITIFAGGNTKDELIQALGDIIFLLKNPECIEGAAVGAEGGHNYTCAYRIDPDKTPAAYNQELAEYIPKLEAFTASKPPAPMNRVVRQV